MQNKIDAAIYIYIYINMEGFTSIFVVKILNKLSVLIEFGGFKTPRKHLFGGKLIPTVFFLTQEPLIFCPGAINFRKRGPLIFSLGAIQFFPGSHSFFFDLGTIFSGI